MTRCLALVILVVLAPAAQGQVPRINTFFPNGARTGSTVEVEIRGSSLEGAETLVASGRGITAAIDAGGAKVDETHRPLWQNKCGTCHELRSPANRSLTPAQWAATVDRMVKVRGAPLSAEEQKSVTDYLVSAARAGKLTARITVAPDTRPGIYELRALTPRGVSTAALFEVGNLPEVTAVRNSLQDPLPVTLPCVVNGNIAANAERHFVRFSAKGGQRLVFNLKGFRFNEASQVFFNPNLRLYDSRGKELASSHGHYDLDPLIDWTCPQDGDYTLEVRDLLGRGNPGSVYRLAMGALPYDTALYPPAAKAGTRSTFTVTGKNSSGEAACSLEAPAAFGVVEVNTPVGPQPLFITPNRVVVEEIAASGTTVLPAGIAGRLMRPGESDTFSVAGNGAFEIEMIAQRVGSTVSPRAFVLTPEGRRAVTINPEGRANFKFEAGKTYTILVEEPAGLGGRDGVYFLDIRPQRPALEVAARPDSISLRPGLSVAVHVILTRREGLEGDVAVTAEGLPEGVRAAPLLIPPDRNQGWLLLSADSGAQPSAGPIRILASGKGPAGEVKAAAVPQFVYQLNNNDRAVNRSEQYLAVRGKPEFFLAFASDGPIAVRPREGVTVRVRINRQEGFNGPVTVYLTGLPEAWIANPVTANPNTNEVSLLIRPTGANPAPFVNRGRKLTPVFAVLEGSASEQRFAFAAAPVLAGQPSGPASPQP